MEEQKDNGIVKDEEQLARFVYSPRNIDPVTESLKDNFIFLRKDEKGISCVLLDRAGEEQTLKIGKSYIRNKKGKEEKLYGWGVCKTGEIRGISPKIDVVLDDPYNKPYHAEIQFTIDGEAVKGKVTHPEILDYFDRIRNIMSLQQLSDDSEC